MPIFKKVADAPEGDLNIATPAGSVLVPASGTVEVSEELAVELRLVYMVSEVTEPAAPAAPVAAAASATPADSTAPTTSKESK
jgi:hypothetical protein